MESFPGKCIAPREPKKILQVRKHVHKMREGRYGATHFCTPRGMVKVLQKHRKDLCGNRTDLNRAFCRRAFLGGILSSYQNQSGLLPQTLSLKNLCSSTNKLQLKVNSPTVLIPSLPFMNVLWSQGTGGHS